MRNDHPPWVETCSVLWETHIVCYKGNVFVEKIVFIIYLAEHNQNVCNEE